MRKRMQETISDSGCKRLDQTTDAGVFYIRQWMQETLYQTADAGVSISDSGCRSLDIRQRMQETLYQTVDARDSISDSGCRSLYIRQPMHAGVSLSDSG